MQILRRSQRREGKAMRIKTVTITGADDSINPRLLIELSQEFPFVEWGILLSQSSVGGRRFPSFKWMKRLQFDHSLNERVKISGHVCDKWVRDILVGEISEFTETLNPVYGMFRRIQINTHGEKLEVSKDGFIAAFRVMR